MNEKMKKEKRIQSLQEAWRFQLDESKKNRSLAVIRQAAEKKQIRQYPSFRENLWNQFCFLPWKCRAAQGSMLLAAMLLAGWLNSKHADGRDSIIVCSVFLVFAGNICLSGVARLFSWHMAELEQTLYLNLKQMVCIRMLEAGILDLVILSLLAGMTGRLNSLGTGAYLLYMRCGSHSGCRIDYPVQYAGSVPLVGRFVPAHADRVPKWGGRLPSDLRRYSVRPAGLLPGVL